MTVAALPRRAAVATLPAHRFSNRGRRAGLIVLVTAVHASALIVLPTPDPAQAPPAEVEISFAIEPPATEPTPPAEPVEPEPEPVAEPEPIPEPEPPPEQIAAPEPEPVIVPEPPKEPLKPAPKPTPKPKPQAEAPRRAEPRRQSVPPAAQTGEPSPSARPGRDPGYAARVRAILQARVDGLGLEEVSGVVAVAFTVGSSGRLVSHSLVRASGNFAIDRAIRAVLASISFPPPPGGSFAGNVSIRIR